MGNTSQCNIKHCNYLQQMQPSKEHPYGTEWVFCKKANIIIHIDNCPRKPRSTYNLRALNAKKTFFQSHLQELLKLKENNTFTYISNYILEKYNKEISPSYLANLFKEEGKRC